MFPHGTCIWLWQHGVFTITVVLLTITSVSAVPSLSSVTADVPFLPTAGGATLTLAGSGFGSDSSKIHLHISATGGSGFSADVTECHIVQTDVQITCPSPAGVGVKLTFDLYVGDTVHSGPFKPAAVISYAAPTLDPVHLTGFDTRGAEKLTVKGSNFGSGLGKVVVRYGDYMASKCSASSDSVVVCTGTAPGVGSELPLTISVAGQNSATSSAATLSYKALTLKSATVVGTSDPTVISTSAKNTVRLTGDMFGPIHTQLAVTYTAQGSPPGTVYTATNCVVTEADVSVDCKAAEGVGTQLHFTASLSGNDAALSTSLRYASPTLTGVTINSPNGKMPTSGSGVVATLSGTGFGPFTDLVPFAWYGGSLGKALQMIDCVVKSDVSITCQGVTPGIGTDHLVVVSVAHQESSPSKTAVFSFDPPEVKSTSLAVFQTDGSSSFTLAGSNLGPSDESTWKVLGISLSVSYGSYIAKSCYVSTANVAVTCNAVEGMGTGLSLTLSAGTQKSVLPSKVGYAAPSISSFSSGVPFPTDGTGMVVIEGSNLGPDDVANKITATYGPASNPKLYSVTCEIKHAHTSIRCGTQPGTGADLSWTVHAALQTATNMAPSTSYDTPHISKIELPEAGSLSTEGGESITVKGKNFGPTVGTLLASYANADASYPGLSCTMITPHSVVSCLSKAGVGMDMMLSISVSSLSTVSSSKFRYTPPVIEDVSASSPLQSKGGSQLQISGSNFGPVSSQIAPSVVYTNSGGLSYSVPCSVSSKHPNKMLLCTTDPGVGSDLEFSVSVGYQKSKVFGSSIRFAGPTLSALSPVISFTAPGSDRFTITGSGFGQGTGGKSPTPSNLVQLTYGPKESITAFKASDCEVISSTSLTCLSDEGMGKGHHFEVTIAGQSSGPSSFTVAYSPPVISSIDTDDMATKGGTWVTISGQNFGPKSSS